MSKIIIHNVSFIDDITAMELVRNVIDKGKVSNGTYGKQYCFVSTFEFSSRIKYPDNETFQIHVSCRMNKNKTSTFHIWENK